MVQPSRLRSLAAASLAAAAFGAAAAQAGAATTAAWPGPGGGPVAGTPGGQSAGDSIYTTIGNTGYDALHYDLDLSYGERTSDPITGTVTIAARATQALSQFSLDYGGTGGIGGITVNGAPARFATTPGRKLVITPARTLRRGLPFVVRISGFRATATQPADGDFIGDSVSLAQSPSGLFTAGQSVYTSYWLPSNDTPADKASFSFRLTAPDDLTAVANGRLLGKRKARGGRTRWIYEQRQPLATELVQLAVGHYQVIERRPVGRTQIRDVVAKSPAAQGIGPLLDVEREQVAWMERRVGPYPFDLYGTLIADTPLGFALETQTLSLFDPSWWDTTTDYYSEGYWKSVMNHELTHQWFGDSVSPSDWADVWLNEGHATWYEFSYADAHGYLADDTFISDDFDEVFKTIYASGDNDRAASGPVARPKSDDPFDVFSTQAYTGGALVLYALRQEIGTAAFERLERTWVAKYRYGNATTADFIDLASRVAHRDLHPFLTAWLYGTKTPPMPGHPDWTVDPVDSTATTQSRRVLPAGWRAEFRKR